MTIDVRRLYFYKAKRNNAECLFSMELVFNNKIDKELTFCQIEILGVQLGVGYYYGKFITDPEW